MLTATGTPTSAGISSFTLNTSVSCTFQRLTVITVTTATGKVWMDRNLGATQAATSLTDTNAFGSLFQWGRGSDGHEIRTSNTSNSLSNTDQPGSNFILTSAYPFDWRSPQNANLWQGANGANNPCPNGFRLPTMAELNAEILTWSSANAAGAFASPLKLTNAGWRSNSNGSVNSIGFLGNYWTSSVSSDYAEYLAIGTGAATFYPGYRSYGFCVRCIKN